MLHWRWLLAVGVDMWKAACGKIVRFWCQIAGLAAANAVAAVRNPSLARPWIFGMHVGI